MDVSLEAASLLSKRLHSEENEEGSDLPEAFYPSDKEDCNASLEGIYPSNFEPVNVWMEDNDYNALKQQNPRKDDSKDHELEKVGVLLVGHCYVVINFVYTI